MTVSEKTESPTLRIDLSELKKITDRLFEHIINTRGETKIDLAQSFYWNIPFNKLLDTSKDPTGLDIGSLSDDWDFLSELLEEDNMPVARQFVELATLFRVIGEKLGEKLAQEGG